MKMMMKMTGGKLEDNDTKNHSLRKITTTVVMMTTKMVMMLTTKKTAMMMTNVTVQQALMC